MDVVKQTLISFIILLVMLFIRVSVVHASMDVNWCNTGGSCIGNTNQTTSIYPINDINTFSYTISGSTSNPDDGLAVGQTYEVISTWCISYLSGMQMNLISQVGNNVSEYGFLGSEEACVYTASNGNVLTGRKANIYSIFTISSSGVFYSRYSFYRNAGGFRAGFLNYSILTGSDINTNKNTQQIINNDNSNTQDIINNQNANTDRVVNAQNATTNAINDMNNRDLSSSDKTPVDSSEYNSMHNKEEQLFDKMNSADINSLNVAIDTNSSNWVWNTMVAFFGANSLINGFIISILSIGIIKMALGR